MSKLHSEINLNNLKNISAIVNLVNNGISIIMIRWLIYLKVIHINLHRSMNSWILKSSKTILGNFKTWSYRAKFCASEDFPAPPSPKRGLSLSGQPPGARASERPCHLPWETPLWLPGLGLTWQPMCLSEGPLLPSHPGRLGRCGLGFPNGPSSGWVTAPKCRAIKLSQGTRGQEDKLSSSPPTAPTWRTASRRHTGGAPGSYCLVRLWPVL